MSNHAYDNGRPNFVRKLSAFFYSDPSKDQLGQQIKQEQRQMDSQKQLPMGWTDHQQSSSIPPNQPPQRKREMIRRTLAEDYPGLDYLGIHNVLNAKYFWYRVLWFSLVSICLFIGLFSIFMIITEYVDNPSATLINVKSVEKLLLPQLTICPTHAATINLDKLELELFENNPRLGKFIKDDVLNFAYYMLAGSGFQKMDWKRFDASSKERMAYFYNILRGDKSVDLFFHDFFEDFGLNCSELFQYCQLGDTIMDCCEIFEPIYLIRRGRCFRNVELYQKNFDELGKLRVQLRYPKQMDPKMDNTREKPEIMAYIAEYKPQLAPFPRYYLYPGIWTKMRLNAKRISLFPAEEVCSQEYQRLGKDTCYVEKWLQTHVEGPLNCTYPYVQGIRRGPKLESCEPQILLDNYHIAVETANYTMQSCILACERWEYTVSMEKIDTSRVYKNSNDLPFVYRVDLSYNDLQYELIEEVSTLTFAGLIAQIGGQMSLFMGSSLLNLIQATIMVLILAHRGILRRNGHNRVRDVQSQTTTTMASEDNEQPVKTFIPLEVQKLDNENQRETNQQKIRL